MHVQQICTQNSSINFVKFKIASRRNKIRFQPLELLQNKYEIQFIRRGNRLFLKNIFFYIFIILPKIL